jgi:UDP-N-acetylmuramate dehydrogenase
MILKQNVSLKEHCNYKIGGNANYFFEFKSTEDLKLAISDYQEIDPDLKNVFVLGSGTNVLFSDNGYSGLVLKNSLDFLRIKGDLVEVGSGNKMQDLVDFCLENSLSGLEWAGGLPGTVGGAIRGNAGAFGGEIKDNISEIRSFKINSISEIVRSNDACRFSYRESVFKIEGIDEIILSALFKLKKGDFQSIKSIVQENMDFRKSRHPLEYPNIGSTFKNVPIENVQAWVLNEFENSIKNDPFPVVPAAKLIGSTDLIGKIVGGAQISTKHPNFIVNINNASSVDILSLIKIIKTEIKNKYDINLQEEIMII